MSEAQTQSVSTTLHETRASGLPLWTLVASVVVLGSYAAVSLLIPRGENLTAFGDIVQCLVPLLAVTVLLWNASSSEWRKNLFWTMLATDRKSTRLNSSHPSISYAVFCLKTKKR